MFSLFENLREKPRHHRKAAAFGIALSFTTMVFLAWLFVFVTPGQNGTFAEDSVNVKSPFASIKEGFDSSLETISAGFSELREGIDNNLKDFLPASEVQFNSEDLDNRQNLEESSNTNNPVEKEL